MNNCYVYSYIDPLNPTEPFYVGKGSNGRYRDASQKQRNNYLYNKIQQLRKRGHSMLDITLFHAKDLSDEAALQLEIELIAKFGRKDQKKGTLLNYTDGGDGVRGIKPNPILLPYKDQIIQAYHNRKTLKEIATELNSTITCVRYILQLFNIKRRPKGVMKPVIDEQVLVKKYQQHPSVNAIAKEFKCDHKYLKQLLIKNGVNVVDGRCLVFGNKRGRKKKL